MYMKGDHPQLMFASVTLAVMVKIGKFVAIIDELNSNVTIRLDAELLSTAKSACLR
jgi:hypothetical protein